MQPAPVTMCAQARLAHPPAAIQRHGLQRQQAIRLVPAASLLLLHPSTDDIQHATHVKWYVIPAGKALRFAGLISPCCHMLGAWCVLSQLPVHPEGRAAAGAIGTDGGERDEWG
jgi:hypothetical protein